jgi:acetyl esterase/lipase
MVGIAPDYRVKSRFGTTPLEAVADGRLVVRWTEDHAAELGLDPRRIVVCGFSAGGHLALWTAINHEPPGSIPEESPKNQPAALILLSPVSDTSSSRSLSKHDAWMLAPVHQLDEKMPAVLLFQGTADPAVSYLESVTLYERLAALGNFCEFVTVKNGSHIFFRDDPSYVPRIHAVMRQFLVNQRLIPR